MPPTKVVRGLCVALANTSSHREPAFYKPVLVARHLRKEFGSAVAVRDVSFTIVDGTTFLLSGSLAGGLTPVVVFAFVFFLILGLVQFSTLFAGIGSLISRPEDLGSINAALILRFVPLLAPFTMFARIATDQPPACSLSRVWTTLRLTENLIMEKLSPATIERPAIDGWLSRNAAFPLRAVIAPAGYGKTTAIVQHLQRLDQPHAYVRAQPGDGPEHLAVRLSGALSVSEASSFEDLRQALIAMPACTVVIDALDLASHEAMFEVGSFAIGSPPQVRTIVAACRGDAIATPRLFTKGLAALMGTSLLAFADDDIARLCAALHVEAGEADLRAVTTLADGWPAVATAIVRSAASDCRPLHGAYEIWLASGVQTLRRFVESEVNRTSLEARSAFARAVAGEELLDEEWQLLDASGLFVTSDAGTYRLLHPIGAMYALGPRFGTSGSPQRLSLSLLGEFEAGYGGTPIEWLRKRDADIVRTLAVRVGGTATRQELIEKYWPSTERRAAQQCLRTSCSNIRKAIAAMVGAHRVDRYFTCGADDITLHPNAATLDAHRFLSHVHSGDEADKNSAPETAAAHYRAALRLRRGEPAVDRDDNVQLAFAARLNEAYERARARLEAIEGVTLEAERKFGSTGQPSAAKSSRAAS